MITERAPSQDRTSAAPFDGTCGSERRQRAVTLPSTHRLLLAIVIIGTGLRLWQYAANTSLWLDEIAVTRNVLDRPLWDLLTVPLAYDQVAPKGFLLAEKVAATVLGPNDYTLRLFPLICSLALVAFWRAAERVLDGLAALIAVALFAAAAPFVVFAAQVKQYSTDVAVAVLLLWLALDLEARGVSPRRALHPHFARPPQS